MMHTIENDLLQDVQNLAHSINGTSLSPTQQDEYEWPDDLRVSGILQADKGCRKFKVGEVPWTPELRQLFFNLRYLRLCYKKYNGMNINSRTLQRSFQKTTFTSPVLNIEQTIPQLKEEYQKYNQYKRTAHAAAELTTCRGWQGQ
jgi:hypothetical protein